MSRIATPDQARVDRLGLNDTDAFETIYRQYWHSLYLYSYRKLRSTEDAKKIVRTLFINLWEMRMEIPANFSLSEYFYTEVRKQVVRSLSEKMTERENADYVAQKFSGEFTVNSLLAARKPVRKAYQAHNSPVELMRQQQYQYGSGQNSLAGIKWVLHSLTNKISLTNLLTYPKN